MGRSGVKYPPLPASFMAPGGVVAIVVKPAGTVRTEKDDAWGTWEPHTRTVEIDGGAPLRHQWRTLFHEMAHAALDDAGACHLFTDDQQETICDALATARMRERFG